MAVAAPVLHIGAFAEEDITEGGVAGVGGPGHHQILVVDLPGEENGIAVEGNEGIFDTGEGLEIGLKDKLKNLDLSAVSDFSSNLKDSIFENTSGITDAIGGGLFNNLGSSLNLDGLSNFDGYLSDGVSNTDFSQFSDSMGIAIGDAVEDGVRGVDYTKIFSLDDLLADNSLYEQLKSEGYGMNSIIGKDGLEKKLEKHIINLAQKNQGVEK